jgi:hypothetical protein
MKTIEELEAACAASKSDLEAARAEYAAFLAEAARDSKEKKTDD